MLSQKERKREYFLFPYWVSENGHEFPFNKVIKAQSIKLTDFTFLY